MDRAVPALSDLSMPEFESLVSSWGKPTVHARKLLRRYYMGSGTVESIQRATMRQAGGDGHAVLKYITQEQFDAVRDDPAIKEIAFDMALCDGVDNEALLKRRGIE